MRRLYFSVLVALQFAALWAIAHTGPLLAPGPWLLVEAAGVLLGLWALWSMQLKNFKVAPSPKVDGSLVQRGPYRIIRHPMYTALLLLTAALVIGHFSWLRLLLWGGLVLVLQLKLTSEEQLLQKRFADYSAYTKTSKRLIPYIY